MRHMILVSAVLAALVLAGDVHAQNGPYQYFPLSPCRSVDTRGPVSVNGGPILGHGATRTFAMRGTCGVPTTAKAVSLNMTVTGATQPAWLTAWPAGGARPVVSMINFEPSDPALANGLIVGLAATAQDLSVFNSNGNVHLILDVTGYFQ